MKSNEHGVHDLVKLQPSPDYYSCIRTNRRVGHGSNPLAQKLPVLRGAGDAQSASAMDHRGLYVFWQYNWSPTDTVSSILKGHTLWCTPSSYFCIDNPWGPDTMWGSMKYSRKSRSLWPSMRFQFFSSGDEKRTRKKRNAFSKTGQGFTQTGGMW